MMEKVIGRGLIRVTQRQTQCNETPTDQRFTVERDSLKNSHMCIWKICYPELPDEAIGYAYQMADDLDYKITQIFQHDEAGLYFHLEREEVVTPEEQENAHAVLEIERKLDTLTSRSKSLENAEVANEKNIELIEASIKQLKARGQQKSHLEALQIEEQNTVNRLNPIISRLETEKSQLKTALDELHKRAELVNQIAQREADEQLSSKLEDLKRRLAALPDPPISPPWDPELMMERLIRKRAEGLLNTVYQVLDQDFSDIDQAQHRVRQLVHDWEQIWQKRQHLERELKTLLPEAKTCAVSDETQHDLTIVGQKISALNEQLRLSREEVRAVRSKLSYAKKKYSDMQIPFEGQFEKPKDEDEYQQVQRFKQMLTTRHMERDRLNSEKAELSDETKSLREELARCRQRNEQLSRNRPSAKKFQAEQFLDTGSK